MSDLVAINQLRSGTIPKKSGPQRREFVTDRLGDHQQRTITVKLSCAPLNWTKVQRLYPDNARPCLCDLTPLLTLPLSRVRDRSNQHPPMCKHGGPWSMTALQSANVLFQGLSMRAAIGVAIIIIGLGSLAKSQSLQEQEMCAKQTPNALQYWKEKNRDQQSNDYWFQNHYNTRLKKCFVNIRYNKSTFSAAVLIDVYEYRTYAVYFEMNTQKSNFRCDLIPSSLEKRSCSSKKEFDAFVSKYMEE